MPLCNECGNECTTDNEVTKMPENIIEHKCNYCYADMMEYSEFKEEQK